MRAAGLIATAIMALTALPAGAETESLLVIEPGAGNPRNSEGDIIELKDGGLCLIYSRFTGGSGDDAAADLAMRVSQDEGKTWSDDIAQFLPENIRRFDAIVMNDSCGPCICRDAKCCVSTGVFPDACRDHAPRPLRILRVGHRLRRCSGDFSDPGTVRMYGICGDNGPARSDN